MDSMLDPDDLSGFEVTIGEHGELRLSSDAPRNALSDRPAVTTSAWGLSVSADNQVAFLTFDVLIPCPCRSGEHPPLEGKIPLLAMSPEMLEQFSEDVTALVELWQKRREGER